MDAKEPTIQIGLRCTTSEDEYSGCSSKKKEMMIMMTDVVIMKRNVVGITLLSV
jgi:hypothetical protein